MSARQVFIIWTHPLFQESIALLLPHAGIEQIGEICDHDSASKQIEKLRPNALLIEEAEAGDLERDEGTAEIFISY